MAGSEIQAFINQLFVQNPQDILQYQLLMLYRPSGYSNGT